MRKEYMAIHRELHNIARLQGLYYARYHLMGMGALSLFYYLAHHYGLYCFYPLILAFITPTLVELIFKDGFSTSKTFLPVLQEKYHYTKLRHLSLFITFWLCNILLFLWQLRLSFFSSASWLANHIPIFLLLTHLLCYIGISYYYQFKFHYQLINNRW